MYKFHGEVQKDFPGGLPLCDLTDGDVKNFTCDQKTRFSLAVDRGFYASTEPVIMAIPEPEPEEQPAEVQPEAPVILEQVEEVAPVEKVVVVKKTKPSK